MNPRSSISSGLRVEIPRCQVHELFERQARRTPDAPALIYEDRRMTYRELNESANRVARRLRRFADGSGELIGIALRRCPDLVVALLATWKSGNAYVPLDPTYPAERLAFMANDAGLRMLMADEKSAHLFRAWRGEIFCPNAERNALAREGSGDSSLAGSTDLAYAMYTSGSTGQPKAAMILHRGLVNYLCWAIEAYRPRAGASAPLHSSISFDLTVTSLYLPLLTGGCVELLPEDAPEEILVDALRREGNRSLVKITPAHLELIGAQLQPGELSGRTDAFVIGGEALLAESLHRWREHAPHTRLINEYGPTETVVGCCTHEVLPGDPMGGAIPIGRPIANTALYVLDAEQRPVAPGETGELHIGGAGVARGYLNRPGLTHQRFLPDPFHGSPGAKMYRTGDLARMRSDGLLECLGRIDDQVKIRGYRIEPAEIEQALAAHPEVRSCAVVALGDQARDRHLLGYVVPRAGCAPDREALQAFLRERMPDYMVPARLVVLEKLPLTANGKVDRKALAHAAEIPIHERSPVAARSPTEQRLAEIWRQLLRIGDVDPQANVFDLGVHSLMAMSALLQIREAFRVDLQLRNLVEHPTVAGQARVIDGLSWIAKRKRTAVPGDREEVEL